MLHVVDNLLPSDRLDALKQLCEAHDALKQNHPGDALFSWRPDQGRCRSVHRPEHLQLIDADVPPGFQTTFKKGYGSDEITGIPVKAVVNMIRKQRKENLDSRENHMKLQRKQLRLLDSMTRASIKLAWTWSRASGKPDNGIGFHRTHQFARYCTWKSLKVMDNHLYQLKNIRYFQHCLQGEYHIHLRKLLLYHLILLVNCPTRSMLNQIQQIHQIHFIY